MGHSWSPHEESTWESSCGSPPWGLHEGNLHGILIDSTKIPQILMESPWNLGDYDTFGLKK